MKAGEVRRSLNARELDRKIAAIQGFIESKYGQSNRGMLSFVPVLHNKVIENK